MWGRVTPRTKATDRTTEVKERRAKRQLKGQLENEKLNHRVILSVVSEGGVKEEEQRAIDYFLLARWRALMVKKRAGVRRKALVKVPSGELPQSRGNTEYPDHVCVYLIF